MNSQITNYEQMDYEQMNYEIANYKKIEFSTINYVIVCLLGLLLFSMYRILKNNNIEKKIIYYNEEEMEKNNKESENNLKQSAKQSAKQWKETKVNSDEGEDDAELFDSGYIYHAVAVDKNIKLSENMKRMSLEQTQMHRRVEMAADTKKDKTCVVRKKKTSVSVKKLSKTIIKQSNGLNIMSYSDKAYVIYGNGTYNMRHKIKSLGGKWSYKLTKFPYKGWIMSNKKITVTILNKTLT